MIQVFSHTTEEQRHAAKKAAWQNYNDKLFTPDRPGWTAGKCPVSEYYAKIGELGAANALGYDWHNLCLYSPNPADYKKPDIGDWDIKAGSSFTDYDIAKGVRFILWVTPWNNGNRFACNISTCKIRKHETLSGVVEIRGWTDLADLDLCSNFGGRYKPAGTAMRNATTIPVMEWGVAA